MKKNYFSLLTSLGNTTHSSNYKIKILSSPRSGIAIICLTIYVKSSFMQKIIFLCKFELFSHFLGPISRFSFIFNQGFVSFQPVSSNTLLVVDAEISNSKFGHSVYCIVHHVHSRLICSSHFVM